MERALRITLHPKRHQTIEVRVFIPRARGGGWHRTGTLCMAEVFWHQVVRPLLTAGAFAVRVKLTVETPVRADNA